MSKQMQNIIKNIRDKLREDNSIMNMDSISHCICFLICRVLDKRICEKLNIPLEFSYENILLDNNGKELGEQEFFCKFYNKDPNKDSFYKYLKFNIKYDNFQFKIKGPNNLVNIVKLLKNINIDSLSNSYDLVGLIYENHLKSGTSNARDLGQFFTHRLVIKYMIKLCDPKMINGKIETIVDPTMGTGGFLTMAIKYLNQKYNNIDWSKNKEYIFGFDIDENVKNMAILNLLLETHEMFNTLKQSDTLKNDMCINNIPLDKVDIILANEPMGLKNIKYDECCDRITDLKIRGTKAEPLFLQLFMQALAKNGRCTVVVPNGVLFNDSNLHKNTRKYLIENFNLKKVISLNDKNFFLNTGVSTSVLFFENNGKTQEVEFLELNLNNDETDVIEKQIIKVKYRQIKDNNYTLFVNKFIVKEEEKIEGIEYKKLGDICIFLPKSKRSASFGKDQGTYPFYTSSMKSKFCDEADYTDKCIIIGTGGNANIKIDKNFSCSADNFILKCNNPNVEINYLYYYFMININILKDGFFGSTIKHISKEYIINLEIPIPSPNIQKKIVERLDLLSDNNKTCEKMINEFKQIMKIYVETHTQNGEEKKLGDICEIKSGKRLPIGSNLLNIKTEYPYIRVIDFKNISVDHSNIKYISEDTYKQIKNYVITCNDIYVSIAGTIGLVGIIPNELDGANLTENAVRLVINNSNIKQKYLLYILYIHNDILKKKAKTTTIPKLSIDNLKNIIINYIDIDKQIILINYCDNIMNQINFFEKQIDDNNILMKQILDNYLSNNEKNNDSTKSKKIKIKKI